MTSTSPIAGSEAYRNDSSQPFASNQHSKIVIACTVGGASLVITTGLVFCLLVWRRRTRHEKIRSGTLRKQRRSTRRGRPSLTTSSGRGTLGSSGDFEALTSPARDHHFTWSPTADDLGLPLPQSGLWSDTMPAPTSDILPSTSRLDSSLRRIGHRRIPSDHLSITNETHFEQATSAAESGECDVISLANERKFVELISSENSRRRVSSTADNSARGFVYNADQLSVRQCSFSSKITSGATSEDVTDDASGAFFCTAVKTHGVADSRLRNPNECFDMPDRNTWEMVGWDRRVDTMSRKSCGQDVDTSSRASVWRAEAVFTERLGNDDDNPVWVQRIPESTRRFTGLRDAETGLGEQPWRVGTNRNSEYDNLTNGFDVNCHVVASGSQRGCSGYRLVPRSLQ